MRPTDPRPDASGDPDLPPVLGRTSSRLRVFRELRAAGARRREGLFFLEGPHLVERLLAELRSERSVPYRLRAL